MIKIWCTWVMHPTWSRPRKLCFNSRRAAEDVCKLYTMSETPVYLGRYREDSAIPAADADGWSQPATVKLTYYRSVKEYCVLEGVTYHV